MVFRHDAFTGSVYCIDGFLTEGVRIPVIDQPQISMNIILNIRRNCICVLASQQDESFLLEQIVIAK